MIRLLLSTLLLLPALDAQIIGQVRQAAQAGEFTTAEKALKTYRQQKGATPEYLEAYSWLGRGAQANKQWEKAAAYSAEAKKMAEAELAKRPLDQEKHLPIALGAAIEVEAHTLANTGRLSEALSLLNAELKRHHDTSIRTRLQKNAHLLSLDGKPAPALELKEWLEGPKVKSLASLKGRSVFLFFWAHWCGDCKYQAPILANLRQTYPAMLIVAPTQRYGYAANGDDATPEQEKQYIEAVRKQHYAQLMNAPAPLSEENFRAYGSSTTPTLVLVDAAGTVRMYHPGKMSAEELTPFLDKYAR